MGTGGWVWGLTIVGLVGLLAFDFFAHVRRAHTPTLREAAIWSLGYVGVAVLFGVGLFVFAGVDAGSQYFAGYLTEKALSVDNLFVFLLIMTSFRVPPADRQKALLFGIVLALIVRTGFIFLGVALINTFSWAFYFLGLILLLTAAGMLRADGADGADGDDTAGADNFVIRLVRKIIPASEHYDGDRLLTTVNGRRVMTPMLLVMIAIAGCDLVFALDSLPAVFGLTHDSYIVFTVTAFALLGLRQLYFLVAGLLDRLVYLSTGLVVILGFIGVKLILHGLHQNTLGFINDGRPLHVVEIGTGLSLVVIGGVLAVTTVASLLSPRGRVQGAPAHDPEPELALRS
ncbi:TerC/Alx family metal homeostasis membrane protein [Mycolicibacter minnesotensis]